MDLKRGSSVNLGSYYKKPVSWTIIAEKEDEVLLLSDRILKFRPFSDPPLNDEEEPVNWKTSSLRKWLNETLFNELFNERIRPYILLHSYTTKPNRIAKKGESIDSVNGEQEQITEDRITLLSWEECMAYFDFDPENKMRQSTYEDMKSHGIKSEIYDVLMAKKGLKTSALPFARSSATLTKHYSGKRYDNEQSTYFWLRSPGCNPNTFAYSFDGLVNREGKEYNEVLGVRPTIWISKATLAYILQNGEKYADDMVNTPEVKQSEYKAITSTHKNGEKYADDMVNTPEVKQSEYKAITSTHTYKDPKGQSSRKKVTTSTYTYKDPHDIFIGILLILAGILVLAISIFLAYFCIIVKDPEVAIFAIVAFIGACALFWNGVTRIVEA